MTIDDNIRVLANAATCAALLAFDRERFAEMVEKGFADHPIMALLTRAAEADTVLDDASSEKLCNTTKCLVSALAPLSPAPTRNRRRY
jgi:hypothetical protein